MAKSPKRQNLKPPGKCIFCGKGDLSKQHVWPEWLKAVNPTTGDYHNIHVSRINYYEPLPSPPRHDAWKRQGEAGSRKIRAVCQKCNNEWISQVEKAAKPTVEILMRDEWVYVTREEQRRVAAWLAIVTVMTEFLDLRLQAIPPEDRTHIWNTSEPPPDWKIWVARYRGTQWDDHVCRRKALVIGEGSEPVNGPIGPPNTQTTTVVLGNLCAHIYSSTAWPDFPGYQGQLLQPLWPIRGYDIFWPSVPVVTDDDILSLVEALPRGMKAFDGRSERV